MTVASSVKKTANHLLSAVGHRIEREALFPSVDRLAATLNARGLTPQTIVDIGVAEGTPWIYNAWPRAKYFLVDPTPHSLPYMHLWAKHINATVCSVALGDTTGTVSIKLRDDHAGSTIFEEVGKVEVISEMSVPLQRFDVAFKGKISRPSFVKIDVQGSELRVLRGMQGSLSEIDMIVVETAIIPTLHGAPHFAEVVEFMASNNFVIYDFVGILRRPLDEALAYVDAVFVPADSPLRSDRRWA